jgi:hypothetical protein
MAKENPNGKLRRGPKLKPNPKSKAKKRPNKNMRDPLLLSREIT